MGGSGMFGPQMWQTISLDPELRPFMNDQDFVQKINMLNANPQMAMQMGVLNDPKIKKVFEKLMGMSFGTGPNEDDNKKEEENESKPSENPYSASSEKKKEEKKEKEKTPPPPEPELTEEEKKEREEQRKKEEEALKHKEEGNKLYKDKKYKEAIVEYK